VTIGGLCPAAERPIESTARGPMSLQDLANLGEFIGGIAVIVSLVYLAIQIRQNTQSLRAATFQTVADSISELVAPFATDSDLGRIFVAGLQADGSLSEDEERQFHFMLLGGLRRFENAYMQWRSGVLSDEQFEGFRNGMVRIIRSPGGQRWWPMWRDHFGKSFREFVSQEQDGSAVMPGDQDLGAV
jgi:hypothetical protein